MPTSSDMRALADGVMPMCVVSPTQNGREQLSQNATNASTSPAAGMQPNPSVHMAFINENTGLTDCELAVMTDGGIQKNATHIDFINDEPSIASSAASKSILLDKIVLSNTPGIHHKAVTVGFMIAVLSQIMWGCYPGFTRYLQVNSHMGPFCIVSTSSLVVAIVLGIKGSQSQGFWTSFSHLQRPWLFYLLLSGRSITNIFSTRFTLSIYVQLTNLSGPFFVTLFNKLVFKEKAPPYTLLALCCSLIGACLALFGGLTYATADDGSGTITGWDVLGITLALLSSAFFAGFMVFLRTISHQISPDGIMVILMLAMASFSLPLSLILEDWTVIPNFQATDWVILIVFWTFVWLGGNWTQVPAIRILGPPLVAVLMPCRLVVALIVGVLLLHESLAALQIIGVFIVLVSVAGYLWKQYSLTKQV